MCGFFIAQSARPKGDTIDPVMFTIHGNYPTTKKLSIQPWVPGHVPNMQRTRSYHCWELIGTLLFPICHLYHTNAFFGQLGLFLKLSEPVFFTSWVKKAIKHNYSQVEDLLADFVESFKNIMFFFNVFVSVFQKNKWAYLLTPEFEHF